MCVCVHWPQNCPRLTDQIKLKLTELSPQPILSLPHQTSIHHIQHHGGRSGTFEEAWCFRSYRYVAASPTSTSPLAIGRLTHLAARVCLDSITPKIASTPAQWSEILTNLCDE